jgi:transcriptional regulator with XRE-family HTH domain
MQALGRAVRQAREAAAIGQRELAIRAGTSQSAISRIENGLEEPSLERFRQIMRGLGYAASVELQPLAQPDADLRQLLDHARMSPQARFDECMNWSRFLRRLKSVSDVGDRA